MTTLSSLSDYNYSNYITVNWCNRMNKLRSKIQLQQKRDRRQISFQAYSCTTNPQDESFNLVGMHPHELAMKRFLN